MSMVEHSVTETETDVNDIELSPVVKPKRKYRKKR